MKRTAKTVDRVRRHVFRVAIVGGGPNGIATLGNLKEQLRKIAHERDSGVNVEIVVFDPLERPLLQGPFALDQPTIFRCNQRSHTMGWSCSDVRGFRDWMETKYPNAENEFLTHPPRSEFGFWLENQGRQIERELRSFGSVQMVTQAVVGLRETEDGVVLEIADGSSHEFDAVVLANSKKQTRFPDLIGVAGFFSSGYPVAPIINRLPCNQEVAIIGSSLSAIDCANALHYFGHQPDRIRLFSRCGLIPATLSEGREYEPKILRRETLERWASDPSLSLQEVKSAIIEEIEWAVTGLNLRLFSRHWKPLPTQEFLEKQLHASRHPQIYQSILRNLFKDGVGECVFRNLPIEEQIFLKTNPFWKSYRHSMAAPTAKCFKAVIDGGCVVHQGLQAVERAGNRFLLIHKNERGKIKKSYAEFVIDATGGTDSLNDPMFRTPLISSIFDAGLSEPHPAGGLKIDFATLRLSNSKRVYALGQLISGAFLYVSGLDAIARTSKHVAESIVEQFSQSRTMFSRN